MVLGTQVQPSRPDKSRLKLSPAVRDSYSMSRTTVNHRWSDGSVSAPPSDQRGRPGSRPREQHAPIARRGG